MARHTIQIPITKSSNGTLVVYGDYGELNGNADLLRLNVSSISNKLYLGLACNMGVGWDSNAIPKNKNIISASINLYSDNNITPDSGVIRFQDFGEGSTIPYPEPSDMGFSSIRTGWNKINIPAPENFNSAIFGVDWYYNKDYSVYVDYVRFNSSRASSNKPYIEITYDDIPPDKPTSLYPSGITVSTRDVIRFAWMHNSKEDNEQKGFTLQYSTNGGSSWTTVNQTTPNQFYDMPANTLPTSGTVTWRVRTTDGNDEISEYSTASFTLGIVPQRAPIPLAPISQYLDENKPIRFEWSFVGGSSGETQSKFDLQYSTNGGSSWTTKTVNTVNTFYELPANSFSGGNITWRVRTYNNWNEVSPYSENKSFTVIGSPSLPLISNVSNSGRPTISWQSTDQHVYELQILQGNKIVYDSGSIPSTSDRSLKLPIYLADGHYIARLRIANEYNLYSDWGERSFNIATTKPIKPDITVFSGGHGVTIKVTNTTLETQIYRNGEYVGKAINGTFTDYTGENKKDYQYFARAIQNDNFNDSDIKLGRCRFGGNTLALANSPDDFIKLKYGFNNNITKSNQFGVQGELIYYDGRKYPLVNYSEFENQSKTLSFYVTSKKDIDRFIEMISKKETFLYRNRDGSNIYGSILSFNYDENETFNGYEVAFTITKVDYRGVAYD